MRPGVACIILYDSRGAFILQHRDDDCENLPGFWSFFGGSVEEGETTEEAMRRESWEELAHAPKAYSLFLTEERKTLTISFYVERCEDKSHLRLGEGQGWGWYTVEETGQLKMRENDREILRRLSAALSFPKA